MLVADHNNKALADATAEDRHRRLEAIGGDIVVLVAGKGCGAVAEAASKLDGVKKVIVADDALYEHPVAETACRARREPVQATMTRSSQPRPPSARTSCRASPRCSTWRRFRKSTAVEGADTFERPIYAGNAIADGEGDRRQEGHHGPHRPLSTGGGPKAAPASVEKLGAGQQMPGLSTFVGEETAEVRPSRTDLCRALSSPAAAALQNGDNFEMLDQGLADKLGAARRCLARGG